LFTIPVLRYMMTYGLSHEQLAMVLVVQREWVAKNPRATFTTPEFPALCAGAWR
jgi:acetyl-CoA acetyltransferase